MTVPEIKPIWSGPTVPTPVGELPACILCRRRVGHTWPEHAAQVQVVVDPLAQAAGLEGAA